jgi:GH15 family glucan-1,4-alpha-glucosidase
MVGDPALEMTAEQAVFILLGCTEDWPSGPVPLGNPFQYRDTWIRDAARQISALSQWGFSVEACNLALT